jgi:hypothetical protein
MLFNCLMNTISLEAKAKIQVKERQYVRGNRRHGLSLLKTILTESHLDTNATVNAIRQSISELSSYIVQIDCDITKFNDYVSRLEQSLAARNETSQDLLVNISRHTRRFVTKNLSSTSSKRNRITKMGTISATSR